MQILRKVGQSFDYFFLCVKWLRMRFSSSFLQHSLSPVTDVRVKVLYTAALPLELFRLLFARRFETALIGQPTNQK